MSTVALLQGLATTVRRHNAVYLRVREGEPRLAPYPTASALFEALSPSSGVASEARAWLLRVIVLEYQRARHPLWYALAARGLDPMLGGLRAWMRRVPDADKDQTLHLALAEALGRLRVARPNGPPFPFLTLRRTLERALFRIAADDACERDDAGATWEEAAAVSTSAPHEDPPPFVDCLAHEVGELLTKRSGDDGAVRVLAGAETLDEQMERLASEQLTKTCLQKRHRRAVERVRGDLSRRGS
jgi:hypothetical protein